MSSIRKIAVAVDGPAGAGKSSISKLVAQKLGYLYIDTGAMYRAITWAALHAGVDVKDEIKVTALLPSIDLRLEPTKDSFRVYVNNREITADIRSQAVTGHVSQVASYKSVREFLVEKQRQMARCGGVILDGRDIGSVVLPDAELKIYLTASVDARAYRRWLEVKDIEEVSLEDIKRSVKERDLMDTTRKESPLICVPEAVVVDSSNMSFDNTVEHIMKLIIDKSTSLAEESTQVKGDEK